MTKLKKKKVSLHVSISVNMEHLLMPFTDWKVWTTQKSPSNQVPTYEAKMEERVRGQCTSPHTSLQQFTDSIVNDKTHTLCPQISPRRALFNRICVCFSHFQTWPSDIVRFFVSGSGSETMSYIVHLTVHSQGCACYCAVLEAKVSVNS